MPPEERNRRYIIEKEGIEKKMTTSATNDLGRHPSKKVIMELFGKPPRKRTSL